MLRRGGLEAKFLPQLACVCVSLVRDGAELLWQRADAVKYAAGELTGVPLLYPWANRLGGDSWVAGGKEVRLDDFTPLAGRDDRDLPLHGLRADALPFRLIRHEASALSAVLDIESVPALRRVDPFTRSVEVRAELDDEGLTMTTTVEAGERPTPVAFGYHPLLRPDSGPRDHWSVELPVGRVIELDGDMLPSGHEGAAGSLGGGLGSRAFDHLVTGIRGAFAVESGDRRIELQLIEGYSHAQVWAQPGVDAVSFEPMTAPIDALRSGRGLHTLAPGERYRAAFRITGSTPGTPSAAPTT